MQNILFHIPHQKIHILELLSVIRRTITDPDSGQFFFRELTTLAATVSLGASLQYTLS